MPNPAQPAAPPVAPPGRAPARVLPSTSSARASNAIQVRLGRIALPAGVRKRADRFGVPSLRIAPIPSDFGEHSQIVGHASILARSLGRFRDRAAQLRLGAVIIPAQDAESAKRVDRLRAGAGLAIMLF